MLKQHHANAPSRSTTALEQTIVTLLELSSLDGIMIFLVTIAKLVRVSPDVISPNSICKVIICEAVRLTRRLSPMRGITADKIIPVQERMLM